MKKNTHHSQLKPHQQQTFQLDAFQSFKTTIDYRSHFGQSRARQGDRNLDRIVRQHAQYPDFTRTVHII
jgi:hypothetical protein